VRRFSRGHGARKRVNYIWEGVGGNNVALASTTTVAVALSTPSSRGVLGLGHCTLMAMHLLYRWGPNAGSATALNELKTYVGIFPTDLTQTVPSALLFVPLTADSDAFEKPMLHWTVDAYNYQTGATNVNTVAGGQDIKIGAKRRVGPEDEVDWVLEARSTATISYVCRLLWREGAR